MQLPNAVAQAIPSGFRHFMSTAAGCHWFVRYEHDQHGNIIGREFAMFADVTPILDRNVAMQNHNDGWSVEGRSKSDKLLRRAASVPFALITKWNNEEGIDYFSQDPDMQKRVKAKLNSREFSKLRTAEFKL